MCVCQTNDERVTRYYFPKGGRILAGLTSELRYDWAYGISFAAFGDAAVLLDSWDELRPDAIRVGAGIGGRYHSIVGPIRLDFALRPLYPEDEQPRNYYDCESSADEIPRAGDLFSGKAAARKTNFDTRLPLALNVYITFGEAL